MCVIISQARQEGAISMSLKYHGRREVGTVLSREAEKSLQQMVSCRLGSVI